MKAALVIFNKMTLLDFVGFYDPVTRLGSMGLMPDFEWSICALDQTVTDDRGVKVEASSVCQSLTAYDLLFCARWNWLPFTSDGQNLHRVAPFVSRHKLSRLSLYRCSAAWCRRIPEGQASHHTSECPQGPGSLLSGSNPAADCG